MRAHRWLLLLVAFPIEVPAAERLATPVSSIVVQPGFQVELLRSAAADEGSWISMCFDDQGRIILGLDDVGVARITLADDPEAIQFEHVERTLQHCRGVLYAHNSLYVSATNSRGLYRIRDADQDGHWDEPKLLMSMDYRSRFGHGSNQIVLGPDQMIYWVVGNDVSFPAGMSPTSAYRDPHLDRLLPNPHDAGQDDRVGYVVRSDAAGQRWEVMAGGFRNQVDVAFNEEGEWFTFDADMEWDVGQPWYRPTRINHVVSAGEYGWRWGTEKWPEYFADSLPSTLDTGLGSPTGIAFATGSHFPPPFRDRLFLADWQNGRILQADVIPQGATYVCRSLSFLEGGPLNVCDLAFGPNGALYFITGGRGSQSGLYRVSWTHTESLDGNFADDSLVAPPPHLREAARQLRRQRRQLETWHVQQNPQAVALAWPFLNHNDRWLRFAAQKAIENQPVQLWKQRALQEQQPLAAACSLVALCRHADETDQSAILTALEAIDTEQLNQDGLLAWLRAYQLCFIRLGPAKDPQRTRICQQLGQRYPHASNRVNHLLGELLVYLGDDHVVRRTLPLLGPTHPQEDQIRAARTLTHARNGWNLTAQHAMIDWLVTARSFIGGQQLSERIRDIQDDFVQQLGEDARAQLANDLARLQQSNVDDTSGSTRSRIKQWTVEDFETQLNDVTLARSSHGGYRVLVEAGCLKCHRWQASGTPIGPDLTNVGRRYDARMILESILNPSKAMDPKYRFTSYQLDDGRTVTGRPVGVGRDVITVQIDPLRPDTVEVPRASIELSAPSHVSPMPTGLVDGFTAEEVLDLLALLKFETQSAPR